MNELRRKKRDWQGEEMSAEEDLFEKSLGLHKGYYIFNPEFWKKIYDLRMQLNYHAAIIREIHQSPYLSEEEEIRLIRQVVRKAQEEEKNTLRGKRREEMLKKHLKEKNRKKRRAWMKEITAEEPKNNSRTNNGEK